MSLRGEEVKHVGKPTHYKNAEGRIFLATEQLATREDLTPLYNHNEDVARKEAVIVPEDEEFKLSKATKQQVATKALEDFDVEISMELNASEMREKFQELVDASDNDSQ